MLSVGPGPASPAIPAADIVAAIEQVAAGASVLVIHSSLPALAGSTWSVDRWQLVKAMRRLMGSGKTLLFPAFCFSYAKHGFDLRRSPSETGILADWIRDLPEAHRTPNPIFSFVVAGPEASTFLAADHRDAYGPRSVLARLDDHEAAVIMLGAAWDFCTYLHRMEEEQQVPYRTYKTFTAPADFGKGPVDPQLRVFVRDEAIPTCLNFGIVGTTAREEHLIRSHPLGAGLVEGILVRNLASHCRRRMAENPYFLIRDPAAVAHHVAMRAARCEQPPFRVALIGEANLEPLRTALDLELQRSAPRRSVECYIPPFGGGRQDIRNAASGLHGFDPQMTIFVDTLETIAGAAHPETASREKLEHRVGDWLESVQLWADTGRGKLFVMDPIRLRPSLSGIGEAVESGLATDATDLSARLRRIVSEHSGRLVDTASIAAATAAPVFDPRTWYLGRIGFSAAFTEAIALHLARLIATEAGQTIRAILLDLDGTLWGGIAGEDGLEGIALGGDYPGNAFADFQRALKSLADQGVALALISRNDEDLVLQIVDEHSGMVLHRDDFSTWVINWETKVEGIVEIARRLNLDLASLLFVDDNPVEREAVRRALPAVAILDLRGDVAGYIDALLACPLLPAGSVTQEDLGRTGSLRRLAEIGSMKERAKDMDAFLTSLRVHVHLTSLKPAELARAEQLMAKTNQFNSTLRRYDAATLRTLQAEGVQLVTLTVSDRLNDPEILGLAVLRERPTPQLDSIVLSCRALGKGVEVAVLRHFARMVEAKHGLGLAVAFTPSTRNHLVREALEEAGFRPKGPDWFLEPSSVTETPVRVTDDLTVRAPSAASHA